MWPPGTRVANQAHRQVEPPAHTAGAGPGRFLGRLDQVELLQQVGGAPPAFTPAQVAQARHQAQVLLAGEQVVHRRELAGDADHRAHRIGVPGHIMARDPHPATVGAGQGGQDLHGGHTPSSWHCGPGGHDLAEHARREVQRGFTAVSGAPADSR
jgi:hypothetical protein